MRHLMKCCPWLPKKTTPDRNACYVGIDFGTAYSGWAYCSGSTGAVQLNNRYPAEADATPKTVTMLLYKLEGNQWKAVAWGMDAKLKFLNLRQDEAHQYHLMHNFKLWLMEDDTTRCPIPDNFNLDVMTVVSDFLRFMLNHIVESLTTRFGAEFSKDDIEWCFTVPAACPDDYKDRLRRAASMAGMVEDHDDPRLSIAHEPEAAALSTADDGRLSYRQGDQFIVVDAGGGTVDITYHQVINRKGKLVLSEATYRRGLLAGSVYIDRLFQKYLKERLGRQLVTDWVASYPTHFARMMTEFDSAKRAFTGQEDVYIQKSVRMPASLREMLRVRAPEAGLAVIQQL